MKHRPGYLYLLKTDGKAPHYKIGVAKNVQQRIKELQTGSAVPLIEVASAILPNPYDAERILHNYFAWARQTGEWFWFEPRFAELVVDYFKCLAYSGDFIKPEDHFRWARHVECVNESEWWNEGSRRRKFEEEW